ncbi:MAG: Methionine--tRNA ligase [Firmicutes bacterium ADurb.Bin419]|nr:MAG: Methionine--tRNA ligase [Firmicutes bacterium ADurb.Bin419]
MENYNPDSVRYFLLANGPEKKDTDFSWREFVNSHNGELLGAYGNLINRTLVFVDKYYNKIIPDGTIDNGIREKIKLLFASIGAKIEKGEFRAAIDEIFEFVRFANKYFDTERPWETRTTDINRCSNTIFNCVHMAANLAVLLKPFLPFSSEKVQGWLGCSDEWKEQNVPSGFVLPEIGILFERIDKKVIDIEMQKLSL